MHVNASGIFISPSTELIVEAKDRGEAVWITIK